MRLAVFAGRPHKRRFIPMSPDSGQPQLPAGKPPAPAEAKPPPAAAVATSAPAPSAAKPAVAPVEPPPPPDPPAAKAPAPPATPPPVVEPPPAAPAKPMADDPIPLGRIARSRLRRLVAVGGTLLLLFLAWEVITYFVAYTDDAYVRSDLVAVAPEVTGRIIAIHIGDHQGIKKGDKLFTIDPTPFQLEANQRQAQIEEEQALLKVAQEQLSTAQAALAQATSRHTYASQEQA